MNFIVWISFLGVSFVLGSIPFGKILAAKAAHIDITREGSGNIGATNVSRVAGPLWGLLTLALDLGKGFVPVYLFVLLFPFSENASASIGLACLFGHQFSLFLKFKGGKGVATAFGVYLALSPQEAILVLGIFLLIVLLTAYISLGSLLSAFLMPVFLHYNARPPGLVLASLIMATTICLKHKDNILRLVLGRERKWGVERPRKGVRKDDQIPRRNRNE